MKKILSVFLCFIILIVCLFTGEFSLKANAAVNGVTGECYWWISGTKLTISGNGLMGNYTAYTAPWGTNITEVVIEDGVKSIGEYAFHLCHSLKSIIIPDTVTSIGNNAFYLCTELTSITIPDSVTHIGFGVFFGCFKMQEIFISRSVQYIGNKAFVASSLTEINVDKNNSYFTSENGILFNKDKTTLVCFPCRKEGTTYKIPDTVTCIGNDAFSGVSLTKIIIPNGVTSIGEYAFDDCLDLKSIIIPEGVKTINRYTFSNCAFLVSVTLPDTITFIDERAFDQCDSIKDVWYTGSESDRNNITILYDNFYLTNANWHYDSCIVGKPHSYDNDCDTNCNACEKARKTTHTYETEDNYCGICNAQLPPIVSGDINRDCSINNKDYGLLMQYINNWSVKINSIAADTNKDKNINNKDLGLLLQYINNWNVELI